jgi:asparagine synthase (glutamine-hydrolysing)
MCGIVALLGARSDADGVERAIERLHHRGPDATRTYADADVALGHTRLSIIDLSEGGSQPMTSSDGRYVITFNGEIYNYLELREELVNYPFRSQSDTEVVLAAWSKWGAACLDRLVGMFAFVLWDRIEREAVAVRDRLGVKPLVFAALPDGGLALASEIKALHAAGVPAKPDSIAWATYLAIGLTDYSSRTFWQGVEALPAGCLLRWRPGASGHVLQRWYDLAERVGTDLDRRDTDVVRDEYLALLQQSVRLRFRSDVPVGINLSGGIDSSTLLGLVQTVRGPDSDVKVFTFVTGDDRYDELPWVEEMLQRTRHPLVPCVLRADDVPELAAKIAAAEDEPFGGIPTLAYSTIFARARREGVIVLLDGQGMDEQWAGYDYYRSATGDAAVVQGSVDPIARPECLARELVALAETLSPANPFPDRLRNLQLRDALYTKIPRALRFNDRISMLSSTELREPFLDHRLFELALRQPADRKIHDGNGKWLLRQITTELIPDRVRLAPKRSLQTPQREWLRGPLSGWANDLLETAFATHASWFDVPAARAAWRAYQNGAGDNSFWVWQWLSIALIDRTPIARG